MGIERCEPTAEGRSRCARECRCGGFGETSVPLGSGDDALLVHIALRGPFQLLRPRLCGAVGKMAGRIMSYIKAGRLELVQLPPPGKVLGRLQVC